MLRDAELHRRTLGITGDTDAADIHHRHRQLIRRWHPDRAPRGREAEFLERTIQLNGAREWMLAHPSFWRVERSTPAVIQAPAMRVEAPRTPTVEPVAPQASTRRQSFDVVRGFDVVDVLAAGWRMLKFIVIVYLVVLGLAIAGWLLTLTGILH